MMIKVDAVKLANFKLLGLIYLLFLLSFVSVVKDLYAFEKAAINAGLEFGFSWLKFVVGSIILLINLLALTMLRFKEVIYSILILVVVFFVIPSTVVFINLEHVNYQILMSHNILFWSIVFFSFVGIKVKTHYTNVKSSSLILGVVVIVCMIPFFILFAPYIDLNNLLLKDIYETRAAVALNVDNLFTNYTYSWLNRYLIPALLVFGLYFKKRITIVFCIFSLIFLFLCGANKVVFAGLIMVLLLYRYEFTRKMNVLLKFIVGVSFISWIAALVFGSTELISIVVRRPFMLPALLDILYFDFFQDSFLYWSQSITGSFIDYPYKMPHSYVVGLEYFGKETWNANNGIISDGFMNAGMLGVIINALIVGLFFSIISQLNISHRFFGLLFLFVFSLVSSLLTTVLLTHGGMILLLLAIFVLRNTEQSMG